MNFRRLLGERKTTARARVAMGQWTRVQISYHLPILTTWTWTPSCIRWLRYECRGAVLVWLIKLLGERAWAHQKTCHNLQLIWHLPMWDFIFSHFTRRSIFLLHLVAPRLLSKIGLRTTLPGPLCVECLWFKIMCGWVCLFNAALTIRSAYFLWMVITNGKKKMSET